MGLFKRISRLGQRWLGDYRVDDLDAALRGPRICRFEQVEPRCLMTADLHIGASYYDPASGLDTAPNVFQVQFQGGAAGTQLTHLQIDGSKDGGPLTFNDAIFDTAAGGLGAYGHSPLKIVSHDGFQVTGSQVLDGGTTLDLEFSGFTAGMTLEFTIDVDQVLFVDPAPGDVEVDSVDEGAEFQRSHLVADFSAPHYNDLSASTQFWDAYDANFTAADEASGSVLDLPTDRYTDPSQDQSVLTAGAVAVAAQVPLPNSISGVVFDDVNLNNQRDPQDTGIAGVQLTLYQKSGDSYVATGATTVTDAQGAYTFSKLLPGEYRVVESQPAGYFSVGAAPGTVLGSVRGVATTSDEISDVTLLGGEDSVENDFAEALPNSISGHVGNDVTGNCQTNPDTPGIAGVVLHLVDGSGEIVANAATDEQGNYRFDNLAAGTYAVVEEQPAGWLEDDSHVGTAGGTVDGLDSISQIVLTNGINAADYDFCEVLNVSISGHVGSDASGSQPASSSLPPIPGVTIQLIDSSGKILATTTTDADGNYSFDGMPPGTYSVREMQPAGFFDGQTAAGSQGGTVADDMIGQIVLLSGARATGYDFSEIPPAKLCGYVYVDANNNGQRDQGEAGIAGVTLTLNDALGQSVGIKVTTDANGFYCFSGLRPGTYQIGETQPDGYLDGTDSAGSVGGFAVNPGDLIAGIALAGGIDAEDYDFGELLASSISGQVHAEQGNACDVANGATPISGVVMHLLDASGTALAATTTDAQGMYHFTGLLPGTYTVVEEQPNGYFEHDADVGTAGGTANGPDTVSNIQLGSGVQATGYDFCEIPPASISGNVFQDGPPIELQNPGDIPDIAAQRDGKLTPDDTLLAGVTLQLRDGVTGQPILGSSALGGVYPADQPITTVTDAQGHYAFSGLAPGVYAIYDVTPIGYLAGIDTAGSLGGVVISTLTITSPAVTAQLTAPPTDDAIVDIGLLAGSNSTDNNFSVVATSAIQFFVFPQNAASPTLQRQLAMLPTATLALPPQVTFPFLVMPVVGWTGQTLYTWHLSVVDAGHPRESGEDELAQLTLVSGDDDAPWRDGAIDEGEWLLGLPEADNPASVRRVRFGLRGGTPVVGDFDGDGRSQVGLFKNGRWFLDLNDNGIWDAGDLWANLGRRNDRPVTGDWDGDGKTDIGVYGPAWANDPRAVAHEPGLPDSHNEHVGTRKNAPRPAPHAPHGQRTMKLTAAGKPRADVIDHVFFFGTPGDVPVVGDWNGDGTHTIAVFRNGTWWRDVDGDGKWSKADVRTSFGRPGDLPVVGDFNGDGIDEMGVFRDGTWYIDTNANGVIDNHDQVFRLGAAGDRPVVGDWNADGKSEPGVYRERPAPAARAMND